MLKSFNSFFLPASVYKGLVAKGLSNEQIGSLGPELTEHISPIDFAYIYALNTNEQVIKRLFDPNTPWINPSDQAKYDFWRKVTSTASHAEFSNRMVNELDGDTPEGAAPFSVVTGKDNQVLVIFSKGSLEAIKRDNIVLEVVKAVVQKGMMFCSFPDVVRNNYSLARRFTSLSAHVGQMRPPSPVYN